VRLFHKDDKLVPSEVERLMDFGIAGDSTYDSMARLQLDGVAALYNMLCERNFAYLADEVGMGKTYQALGLAAVLWNLKPDARIVFISPRQALQLKWERDYGNFFAQNYLRQRDTNEAVGRGDDRVTSALLGTPLHRSAFYHRLSDWAKALSRRERTAVFLRHSSFMRPVFLSGAEAEDTAAAWSSWRTRIRGWGLHNVRESMEGVAPDKASYEFNKELGRALNGKLSELAKDGQAIDLLVVDEAQCLRNPGNQTNTVLHEAFRGVVKKWLFLSATPVHSGPDDLSRILNHYPGAGTVLGEDDLQSMTRLQEKLKTFMVRRPRRYVVGKGDGSRQVGKTEYRNHDPEAWAVDELSPLATLSMGLVQKSLVKILAGRSNRYRIGFLSSFESLQDSVRHLEPVAGEEEEGSSSDFHHDPNDRVSDREAPDAGELSRLGRDFEKEFGRSMPHPKLDRVAEEAGRRAFGTADSPGGEKFLIFTRRVSTVHALRDRLHKIHQETIRLRVRRVWERDLIWERGIGVEDDEPDIADDLEVAEDEGDLPFRKAMAKGGWLFRFRQTFRRTGRNSLFFEENWLARLCAAGGVDAAYAAEHIPVDLWAESLAYARQKAGAKTAIHKARRLHYLSVHTPARCPEAFKLTREKGEIWHSILARLYPDASGTVTAEEAQKERKDNDTELPDVSLLEETTLWSKWNDELASHDLALPGAESLPDWSGIAKRQVLKTIIGQTMRLTDLVVDLAYASMSDGSLVDAFLGYLADDDPSAVRVRSLIGAWISQLEIIIRNTFSTADLSLDKLALVGSFSELNKQSPVLGVTGSSRGHQTALRQFRMPGYPMVLVCTDTLKEGVDLHLFCDQVVHYGVAWTSGDLEQRIGRVDRFFSQIERRLKKGEPGSPPQLGVFYPHVSSSLEKGQVDFVIERKRQSERLMDTCLVLDSEETKEVMLDQPRLHEQRTTTGGVSPFGSPVFPTKFSSLPLDTSAHRNLRYEHYCGFADELRHRLQGLPASALSRESVFHRRFDWRESGGEQRRVKWSYDSEFGRYVVSVSPAPELEAPYLLGKRRYQEGHEMRADFVWQLIVPGSDEGSRSVLEAFTTLLRRPMVEPATENEWSIALDVCKRLDGRAHSDRRTGALLARVSLGKRGQGVKVRLGRGMVRVTSQFATLHSLQPSDRWGGAPSLERVRDWAAEENDKLPSGFIVMDEYEGLHFGAQLRRWA
jgi:hypothetical protein